MTKETLTIEMEQDIIPLLGRQMYEKQFGFVVLRELLQNALDAEATEIIIIYNENDKTLIVSDNGTGIIEIKGLLNVIGKSIKNIKVIMKNGGLGLAKLALFGCLEYKFVSIGGSFSTGFQYDSDEKIDNSTIVSCTFQENDTDYWFESKILSFIRSILTSCKFIYNGMEVQPFQYQNVDFNGKNELMGDSRYNGQALIRVNGLPSFYRSIPNLEKTIFIDYQTTAKPYDFDYPLTSNRDSFKEDCKENQDLEDRIEKIQKKLELDKKLSENLAIKVKLTTWRNKKYISFGNVSKEDYDNHTNTIYTYERYIKQIGEIFNHDMLDVKFGLCDGEEENGLYDSGLKCFAISKNLDSKGDILGVACHEYAHFWGYGMNGHDQAFASCYGRIVKRVFEKMFDGKFRK